MDAATLANVKWLMTYINDSKASNIGQLFMAVQTYIWDHQSYKGAGDGTGDAGGYANADTYDLYLGLIDSMLAQKAREDAEFQRQIAEYAARGQVASVIEDDAAKWAVFALSSNRKNQSFFNYYGPRKLVVKDKPQDGDDSAPPAGDADITLRKVAAGTTRGLDGAKFNIYRDGQIVGNWKRTAGRGNVTIQTTLWVDTVPEALDAAIARYRSFIGGTKSENSPEAL